jgi:hypothetical protein
MAVDVLGQTVAGVDNETWAVALIVIVILLLSVVKHGFAPPDCTLTKLYTNGPVVVVGTVTVAVTLLPVEVTV